MKYYDEEEDFHARCRKEKTFFKLKKGESVSHFPRGRVTAITGEGVFVDFEEKRYLCTLKGLFKKEKGETKNLIAVGDWVRFDPASELIVQIEERFSVLSRTDIRGVKEQLIAVNVDQALITVSFSNPPFKPGLIDRYLISAEKGKIAPIIVINKIDLLEEASEEEKALYRSFLSAYEPLGIPILSLSSKTGVGIAALRSLLQNKTSLFAGQSGVGKSSLLNVCFGFQLKTGELTQKTQKGSHTTTRAELIPLPGGGYSVDTPGIRSFAIWDLKKEDIVHHFVDIARFAGKCKFPDCTHLEEPNCAVLTALEHKQLSVLRYNSFQTLLSDCFGGPDQRTKSQT